MKYEIEIEKNGYIWRGRGWTAEIIKNEYDDGWAIEMTPDGQEEPVYMAPWTMGRNKKDPKPLKQKDFISWIKSASEFMARSRFQSQTKNNRNVDVISSSGERLQVIYDVIEDDYEPTGVLTALDQLGEEVAKTSCNPAFQLTLESAEAWVEGGFEAPIVEEGVSYVEEEEVYGEIDDF